MELTYPNHPTGYDPVAKRVGRLYTDGVWTTALIPMAGRVALVRPEIPAPITKVPPIPDAGGSSLGSYSGLQNGQAVGPGGHRDGNSNDRLVPGPAQERIEQALAAG